MYRSPWFYLEGYRACTVIEDGRRRTVLQHREVVEASLGRTLESWEIVHHRDGNKLNNAVENLEVVTKSAHSIHHAKPAKYVMLTCLLCGKGFERRANKEKHNRKQGKIGPFCGKSCAGKFRPGVGTW
jgi:hypothetical protein